MLFTYLLAAQLAALKLLAVSDHGSRSPFAQMRRSIGDDSAKVYRLHPCEKAVVIVAAALLIFQPWALGGMQLWTQYITGSLALFAFILAMIPRHYTGEHHAGPEMKLIMWPKLLRFPIFWLGIVYAGYVMIQIANPAWQFMQNAQGAWWLQGMDYTTWLPHGIANTPAIMMNGWRALLIQGTAWLLICALWVGITRRRSIRLLLTTVALNGVAIALVVLLQRLIGAKKLLWVVDPGAATYFAGSFFYKNHAGNFFILIIAVCLGLAWWHTTHAEHRMRKSHPGLVYVFLSALVVLALMLTYARASTALGVTLMLLVALAYLVRMLWRKSGGPPRIVTAITAMIGIGFVALIVASFNIDSVWNRFGRLFKEDEFYSVTSRQIMSKATIEMAQDSLITGHGVGGFRFLFPLYQQNHPEIWQMRYWHKPSQEYRYGKRIYWEHTHNDYAELLAESGLIGAALLLLGLGFIVTAMWQGFVMSHPPLMILLGGPFFLAIAAAADFPFHNPAVLVTTCAVTALALRWGMMARN